MTASEPAQEGPKGIRAVLLGPPGAGKGTQVSCRAGLVGGSRGTPRSGRPEVLVAPEPSRAQAEAWGAWGGDEGAVTGVWGFGRCLGEGPKWRLEKFELKFLKDPGLRCRVRSFKD